MELLNDRFITRTSEHRIDLKLYPMLKITPMLIMGISMGYLLYGLITIDFWLACLVLFFFLACAFGKRKMLQSLAVLLASFMLGGCLSVLAYDKATRQLPAKEKLYEAVIVSEPQRHGKVLQCDAMLLNPSEPSKVKASFLIKPGSEEEELLHIGQGIVLLGAVRAPMNFPSAKFDYVSWLKLHDYHGELFLLEGQWKPAKVNLSSLGFMRRAVLRAGIFRQKIIRQLGKTMPTEQLSILSAMALGDKSMLNKELKADYSTAGASHVLALSGLHLSIIYIVFQFFFSWIGKLFHPGYRKFITHFLLLLAIWGYVFLVGMSASVLRAALMLSIYAMVTLLNRKPLPLNTLAFVAFVLLLADPLALFDVGFQLSFMATLFILLLYKPVNSMLLKLGCMGKYKVLRSVAGLVSVSVCAQLGTAPLVAYYFEAFPTYFIFTNFVAIPCTTIILYAGLALIVSASFAPVLPYISGLIEVVSNILNRSLHAIASLPGASISLPSVSVLQVVLVYFGIGLMAILFCFYLPKELNVAKK